MATYTTPGVYVQEISTLPPSVAAVPTSIPVFIGYTEKAEINGNSLPLPTEPVRITSMLEFTTIFGGSYSESFDVTLTGAAVDISAALSSSAGKDFRLFYHMQMFFANGGGTCYVISTGKIPTATITGSVLQTAIEQAEKVDEITMVVVPEAVSSGINDAQQSGIYNAMLDHCAKMQDRFALLDVKVRGTSIANDAEKFRNFNVGANDLSYGAAYYPSFTPTLSYTYADSAVEIKADNPHLPASVLVYDGESLEVVNNGNGLVAEWDMDFTAYVFPITAGSIIINGISIDLVGAADLAEVIAAINDNPLASAIVEADEDPTNTLLITAVVPSLPLVVSVSTVSTPTFPTPNESVIAIAPDKMLYNRIKDVLNAFPIELYPSATMAGVYASVDTNRGVWKAPANVGLAMVSSLNVKIKDSDQSGLNVDATSGKSIDAIREFPGRGILVWGARTLDGNSNEWRYVNVRRTFLFVEDSCKKASEFVVFEPNVANTWVRVKGMISNFLNSLWRDGALAGATPEQAFFVKVGLDETMTAQDILEGRLIVMIGMAVVRPAEFIVLQFEHKLQVS
jgi:phage tail sheath protein FI